MDVACEAENKIPSANLGTPEMPSATLIPVRMRFPPPLPGKPSYQPPGECQPSSIRGHTLIDGLPE